MFKKLFKFLGIQPKRKIQRYYIVDNEKVWPKYIAFTPSGVGWVSDVYLATKYSLEEAKQTIKNLNRKEGYQRYSIRPE